MSAPLIEARGIGKRYRRSAFGRGICLPDLSRVFRRVKRNQPPDDFWALKDIDLELKQGDSLGIIGPNGAGKSTLLKILSRVTAPTEGVLKVRGRVGALIEVGAGFHPELSGRDNIYINGAILGMSRREIQKRFDEIVDFAEIEDFIDTPVKKYSSGMYVRLGFAVAVHMEPDILLVDEVLAVGDGWFSKKCFAAMDRFRNNGTAMVLVSHYMPNIERNCKKGLLLVNGVAQRLGEASEVVRAYQSLLQERELHGLATTPLDRGEELCTYDVRIAQVQLLDSVGECISESESGAPLEIVVDYVSPGDCSRFHVEVAVWDVTGSQVAVNGTYLDGTHVEAAAGGRVRCYFPRFPFTSGEYMLQVILLSECTRIRYDIWRGSYREELRLSVRPNHKSALLDHWKGIVDLECRWLSEGPPQGGGMDHT